MVASSLGRAHIEHFLDRAAAKLEGDWLLVGGAAAAVWFDPGRVTEDIDLIGLGGTMAERLALMELASEEGCISNPGRRSLSRPRNPLTPTLPPR